uniref:Carbamoyl phosphate synthase small chain n=1 Tax=Bornetia secundiflora TaxID=2575637 RepID=A0A4D6WT48_9FLOR|nr:Carbamoyl phosphate synthase small subunit [Bornetia secundiflora]
MFYSTFLYLNDGTMYRGWSLFDEFMCFGEVVFNTGMTGYQEILTDPSYSGQIMTFTYPELGNTGLNGSDNESKKIHIKGLIAKNLCSYASNWRYSISLREYIINKRIPHIFGIDTRSLTRHLRSQGVLNGCITHQILDIKSLQVSSFQLLDLVKRVTTNKSYFLTQDKDMSLMTKSLSYYLNNNLCERQYKNLKILVLDFGIKSNIINRLLFFQCDIQVIPATSSYETIRLYKPDGILLSNGPGDPAIVTYAIQTVRQLIESSNIPIFGICMGHQILSLALGISTFKLKFGHRGLNHPVGLKQMCEITSQNHGFAVAIDKYADDHNIFHFNLNDATIAGIFHTNKPIFSVQYHPEASPGPHDSEYLFDVFLELVNTIHKMTIDTI